ncbi:transcription initiation factor TFIID subunit 11-like [Neltuma alba]|uniref:transcription initiation factor TFIID subunit 11-like n=1 Tax=Neltuma alba TaxID=207710 RepID=UPI0010A3DCA7|nr:transcription initiation factor TFIID subunit 11-like [Prosopis alba]
MATNKGVNVPVEPGNVDTNGGDDTEAKKYETLEEKHARLLKKANQDEREVGGNENDKEKQGNENDRDPEQEVIECVDVDGLEEIDDDGIEDLPEHREEGGDSEDDVVREIDKGKRVLVMDEDDDKSEEGGDSEDEEGSDSEDSNYVGNSASSDTEESLVDDFEVSENSEEEDEDMGLNEDCEPPDERVGLSVLEGLGDQPFFMLGMTFLDLNELRSAIDSYAISKGVNIKIIRSEKRLLKAICEEGAHSPYMHREMGIMWATR